MNTPVQKPIEILQYKTNVGYFVKAKSYYPYHICSDMLYNGIADIDYNRINGYIKLDKELTYVQKKIQPSRKVLHYILKDKELESPKLPLIVSQYWDEDLEKQRLKGVEDYESLYEPVFEETEEQLVDVPFIIINMGDYIIENPSNIKDRKIKMKTANDTWDNKTVEEELSKVVVYDDIIRLLTPEFALAQAPCRLTSHQMYRIVRQYLLENLDMKENIITSNYDFCFTVKKRVHTKPFIINESYLAGRNKWKSKSVTKDEKQIEVFEMTYAGYKGLSGYEGYTCIPELNGDNLQDLSEKLDEYLYNLVNALNKKVHECECCNGAGYIVEKANV
jgi:hypothetical protein